MTGARIGVAVRRLTADELSKIEQMYEDGVHYAVAAKNIGCCAAAMWSRYQRMRRGVASIPKDSKPVASAKRPRLLPAVTDPTLLAKLTRGRA